MKFHCSAILNVFNLIYITLPQVSNIRCGFPLFPTCVLTQASRWLYRNVSHFQNHVCALHTHNMSIHILIYISMRKYPFDIKSQKSTSAGNCFTTIFYLYTVIHSPYLNDNTLTRTHKLTHSAENISAAFLEYV